VAEAKNKAERLRDNSERELAAATKRRDSIEAQVTKVRHDLAALGAVPKVNMLRLAEPVADQQESAAEVEQEGVADIRATAFAADSRHTLTYRRRQNPALPVSGCDEMFTRCCDGPQVVRQNARPRG